MFLCIVCLLSVPPSGMCFRAAPVIPAFIKAKLFILCNEGNGNSLLATHSENPKNNASIHPFPSSRFSVPDIGWSGRHVQSLCILPLCRANDRLGIDQDKAVALTPTLIAHFVYIRCVAKTRNHVGWFYLPVPVIPSELLVYKGKHSLVPSHHL